MPRIIIQPSTINIAMKILQESKIPLTIEQWRQKLTYKIYPKVTEEEIKKKKGVSWNTMRTITRQLTNNRLIEPVYAGKIILYRVRPL